MDIPFPTPRYAAALRDQGRLRAHSLTTAFVDGLGVMSFVFGGMALPSDVGVNPVRELDEDIQEALDGENLGEGRFEIVARREEFLAMARRIEKESLEDYERKAGLSFLAGVGVLFAWMIVVMVSLLLDSDPGIYLGTLGFWSCVVVKMGYDRWFRDAPPAPAA